MEIIIATSKQDLGSQAAAKGASLIKKAILERGTANIIVATGASQFEMLAELVGQEINWDVVTAFHLDEYIGISTSHPASFRKYLRERFVDLVHPKAFHYVVGDSGDPEGECLRLGKIISQYPIDVAFVGIGENSHLAFNDPPADFDTEAAYLVVNLDDACRKQQMGEGWFNTLEDVPTQAISMTIKQIMKSKNIICTVPDERKAWAVKQAVKAEISNKIPASILQNHPATWLYLDKKSASLLSD
ncbi:MAG: glucosamine-6-phosphate deaminase [Cyclobacteriaceae bacterium]|nr:glucosamine-6-phosphate deaminase [Cyclobacteriaceae bacterium]